MRFVTWSTLSQVECSNKTLRLEAGAPPARGMQKMVPSSLCLTARWMPGRGQSSLDLLPVGLSPNSATGNTLWCPLNSCQLSHRGQEGAVSPGVQEVPLFFVQFLLLVVLWLGEAHRKGCVLSCFHYIYSFSFFLLGIFSCLVDK